MSLVHDFPIYDSPNYAPTAPILALQKDSATKDSDICVQIRELYEELDKRDEAVFIAIAEQAYVISSFMQGKQRWQQNWFNGGKWELGPPSKNANPNLIRSVNKMQFQVSQMQEDLISSNPDFEPDDMFKTYKHEKEVKASKAVWEHYERKFYDNAQFNQQQALSLICAGTAMEEVVYDSTMKGVKMFREIWGHVPVTVTDGRGQCFDCGFQGKHTDFHQWDSDDVGKAYKEMTGAAMSDSDEGKQAKEIIKSMPMAALPQCSQCGSFATDVVDEEIEHVPSVVGLEQYHLGDFKLNNLAIQAVRYNPAVLPEESSYFIDKRYFPTRKIKHLFGPDINIGEGKDQDIGLDYLYKMSRIGASVGGARTTMSNDSNARNSAILCRMSLSAEEASEIEIPASASHADLETLCGESLPKGKTFGDVFGDCTILGFNGMENVYGIYRRHHSKTVSTAVYFAKANSGTGRGAEDLAEIQKRVNRLDQQQVKAVDGATPGYTFAEGAVAEKHIAEMGFPNVKIPIRREFFNMTKTVESFVKQMPPQQVAPQLFSYAQELDKLMQMTAHVVNLSGAVYGANNKTATGAKILEQTQQAIMIPMLQSKASMRKGTIRNLLNGYKEVFVGVKRSFIAAKQGGKNISEIEVTADKIDPEIFFVVVENSIIPQNYYVRKGDYMAWTQCLQQLGGIETVKNADPKLFSLLAKVFNIDAGSEDYEHIADICRLRMSEAFELADMFEHVMSQPALQPPPAMPEMPQVGGTISPPTASAAPAPATPPSGAVEQSQALTPPPQEGNMVSQGAPQQEQPSAGQHIETENALYDMMFEELSVPIRPLEKDHQQKAAWFQDFLDTHDGLKLTVHQRDICFEFIMQHQKMADIASGGMMASSANIHGAAMMPTQAMGERMGQMAAEAAPQPEDGKSAPKKPKAK